MGAIPERDDFRVPARARKPADFPHVYRMDDAPPPAENKLKLGARKFERVNQPTSEPDPNAIHQILQENKALDVSFELPGIDEEIHRLWKQKRIRDLKVFVSLGLFDLACLGCAAAAHWSPYVSVPLISAGAVVTSSTLWVVYVLMR